MFSLPSRIALRRVLGLSVLFVALTYSFLTNGFGVATWDTWSTWEKGSEAMVMKRIEVDLLDRDAPPLGLAAYAGDEFSVYERLAGNGSDDTASTPPEIFTPYESEIGGQAYFWSFLWREMGCSSISCLHVVGAVLSASAVLAMFVGLSFIGSGLLGWAWLVSAGLSPWIAFAARNLFWSPWLYFLPAIATIGLIVARTRAQRWCAAAGVFGAFVVKYIGTGYHEFTAFTMLAAALPIIALTFGRYVSNGRRQWINALLVLGASALALVLVLLVHATLLAGDPVKGLRSIWVNTVLRRTYGDAQDFDPMYAASLTASPLDVVWKYVWSAWSTDVLGFSVNKDGSLFSLALGRAAFLLLTVACLGIITYRLITKDSRWRRDASLVLLGFAVAVVWLVAAKGYSYVHTHILFFLWYFLYIPALLYVAGSFAWDSRGHLVRGTVSAVRAFEPSQRREDSLP